LVFARCAVPLDATFSRHLSSQSLSIGAKGLTAHRYARRPCRVAVAIADGRFFVVALGVLKQSRNDLRSRLPKMHFFRCQAFPDTESAGNSDFSRDDHVPLHEL
jgi:hypothetical protein